MKQRKVKYSRDAYIPTLLELVDFGDPVDVRDRKTIEILDYATIVEEPWHHCILLPSRRWNPWLAMSEALWILAGKNDVAALKPYNQNIVNFSDDGVVLYGAYGARIYEQIDPLIERLRKDPSDRRAVLQIWDNAGFHTDNYPVHQKPILGDWHEDLITESKDPPCNDMVFFKLRDNKLHMTVMCRSNDIHWGLYAVNLPTFGILQVYIAARLGVDVGTQTHLSNSLHVYTDDKRAVEITDRMLCKESENMPLYPEHRMIFGAEDFYTILDHKSFATMCSDVLNPNVIYDHNWPPFLKFASRFLRQYRNHNWDPVQMFEWADVYPDWMEAAELFVNRVWKRNE